MSRASVKARNASAAKRLAERLRKDLKRGARLGVEACARFLVARIKETLNVPAPKVAIRGVPSPGKKMGPIVGYRATTPAVPGAPPRKVTGRLQQSVTQQRLTDTTWLVGANARAEPSRRYPDGFNYPKHLELGDHPFIEPTVNQYRKELEAIIGESVVIGLRTT